MVLMARAPDLSLLPMELARAGPDLGARIRAARQARRLRLDDVAEKTGLSRKTIEAVERGELSTSLGAYVAVLGAMNLAEALSLVADPGLDREGLALNYSISDKRVRVGSKVDNDF
jgi:transcriptional regulator with XRE-family HTH domain